MGGCFEQETQPTKSYSMANIQSGTSLVKAVVLWGVIRMSVPIGKRGAGGRQRGGGTRRSPKHSNYDLRYTSRDLPCRSGGAEGFRTAAYGFHEGVHCRGQDGGKLGLPGLVPTRLVGRLKGGDDV